MVCYHSDCQNSTDGFGGGQFDRYWSAGQDMCSRARRVLGAAPAHGHRQNGLPGPRNDAVRPVQSLAACAWGRGGFHITLTAYKLLSVYYGMDSERMGNGTTN